MNKTQLLTTELVSNPRSADKLYLVRRSDRVVIGFVSRFDDTATDRSPWRLYNAVCGQGPVHRGSTMLATVFGSMETALTLLQKVAR
jgi:hypothetical protein